jgi:hypothetical protein
MSKACAYHRVRYGLAWGPEMTTTEILTTIQEALAEDAAIESWCQGYFARSVTVLLGVDIQDLPGVDKCPALVIVGATQQRGDLQPKETWTVALSALIFNDAIQVVGNRETYTGMLQAEELRLLAENAIYRARIAATSTLGDVSALTLPSMYESFTAITFTALRSAQRGMG